MIGLRRMDLSDVDAVLKWENDPENWHFSNTESPYSREEIINLVEDLSLKTSVQQRFIVCDLLDGERIGAVDLFEINELSGKAGVGILIADQKWRRKGIGLKSLMLVENEALKYNVNTLVATVHDWNEPSLGLFRRAGYAELKDSEELVKFEKCLKR